MFGLLISLSLLDYGLNLAIDPVSIALGLGALTTGIITTLENRGQNLSNQALSEKMFNQSREWQVIDQNKQQDWTKELLQYQYDNYSSPSAQMAGYKAAGLNPWLLGQGHDIGSGQSVAPQGNSLPTGSSGIPDIRTTPIDNPVSAGFNSILQGSAVQNQRLSSLAQMLQASPHAFKALGKKGFDSVMNSLFGNVVDSSIIQRISNSQELNVQHEEVINSVRAEVAQATSMQYANNLVSLQQMEFAKYSGEFNLMQSEVDVNKSKVRVAASEYVRNIADALHLKKVGDYYEASAETINALRTLTKESLQYRVNSQYRNDITEQVLFEAQRGLREHITQEGEKLNDRFIQNWDIETDPFYNEVSKMLNSWHISTNVGFSGSYGSKDVYGHGFGY